MHARFNDQQAKDTAELMADITLHFDSSLFHAWLLVSIRTCAAQLWAGQDAFFAV